MEYDSNLKQPICSLKNCTNFIDCYTKYDKSPRCKKGLGHLAEVISISPPSKSIQIQYIKPNLTTNQTEVRCPSPTECIDPKNYVRFQNYCIPTYLLRDYLNYKQFKLPNTPSSAVSNDIFSSLDFLLFLCQTMKMTEYCEQVANLCVLTVYNLDKFSPCNSFYTTQTTFMGSNVDTYQSKVVPFLFYAKGRSVSDDLDKVIDFRYKYARNAMDSDGEESEIQRRYPVHETFYSIFETF